MGILDGLNKGGSSTENLFHICSSSEYNAITGLPTVSSPSPGTIYLVPSSGSATNNLFEEWLYVSDVWEKIGNVALNQIQSDWNQNDSTSADYIKNKPTIPTVPVTDVQINGTSILSNGVANVPVASTSDFGAIRIDENYGITINDSGTLRLVQASLSQIKSGTSQTRIITPAKQNESTFYGLAKAAGDSTQSASSNAVGTYTESAKSAIAQMLGGSVAVSGATPSIAAKAGVRYVCGEVSTLAITVPASGIIDVVFESGSTATVLTITPPTGVTAVKWANGFDPTSLDANTTYEINIMDGEYGVAAAWT